MIPWLAENWYAVGFCVVAFSSLIFFLASDEPGMNEPEVFAAGPLICGAAWIITLAVVLAVVIARQIKARR